MAVNTIPIIYTIIAGERYLLKGPLIQQYNKSLLESYYNSLNCPPSIECLSFKETCDCPHEVVFNCLFKVYNIIFNVPSTNVVVFSIPNGEPLDGLSPYTYQWSYDANLFNLTGNATSSTLSLVWKNSAPVQTKTNITLTMTDTNGCTVTKVCSYIISASTNRNMSCITLATCSPVAAATTSNLFSHSFILNWTSAGYTYDVKVFKNGDTIPTFTANNVVNTVSVTGLLANTLYQARIYTHCPDGTVSIFTLPVTTLATFEIALNSITPVNPVGYYTCANDTNVTINISFVHGAGPLTYTFTGAGFSGTATSSSTGAVTVPLHFDGTQAAGAHNVILTITGQDIPVPLVSVFSVNVGAFNPMNPQC